MGASASGPLTHDKLFIETIETRGIMNILLDYMLKNITVRDFLALSNPTECKKYVLFMANRMNQQFYELKIAPERGKKDVIAFRSIKDLVAPDDRTDKEKQSLCLSLAYFYTRIFQIYGALALTLMDDINATRQYETATFLRMPAAQGDSLGTPGSAQVYLHGGMRGGADLPSVIALDNFEFLRGYLRDERREPYGYSARFDETKGTVYFSKENEKRDERQQLIPSGITPEVFYQNGQFAISYPGAARYAYVQMTANNVTASADIRLQIKAIQYMKKGATQYTTSSGIPSQILATPTITIQSQRGANDRRMYTIKELKNASIPDFFNSFFNKVLPYIKELSETDSSATPGMPTPKNLLTPGFKTEDGIDPTFHITRTVQNLQIHKPLAHCIARALQLLKVMPLGNEPGYSSICKAQFLEIQGRTREGSTITYSRSGIPGRNTFLDQSPGLSALAQLFYDTVAVGSPKLEINQVRHGEGKSSLEQYKEFMLKLARMFGDRDGKTQDQIVSAGLHGIKNRRDYQLCKKTPGDEKSQDISENIVIDKPVATKVQGIVQSMFATQLKHAENCGKIFRMLFYIKKEKDSNFYTIRLNDNVIRGGIPEVDRINNYARAVLVDYYSTCETSYMRGMKEVLDHYHQKQTAKQKAEKPVQSSIPQPVQQIQQAMPQPLQPSISQSVSQPLQPHTQQTVPQIVQSVQPVVQPPPTSISSSSKNSSKTVKRLRKNLVTDTPKLKAIQNVLQQQVALLQAQQQSSIAVAPPTTSLSPPTRKNKKSVTIANPPVTTTIAT
jgi:hypothetical protein